ncbi:MAG: efflux RND transporter permease subunit [Bacteroidales bacterium]|nr:efflux RND transporter permease subunit [Bacteroidales bacterium]
MTKPKLSAFSVLIWSVVLMLVGLSLIPLLNVQLSPSRTEPAVSVTYYWADASARVIEQEVTSKLEAVFSGVKGLKEISSVTTKGSGTIDLTFKKNVSMDAIRFELSTLIRRVYDNFPDQVSYPQLSVGSGGTRRLPVLTYTLNASSSPFHIKQYAESNLVPKLAAIKGVNDVSVYGATVFEWVITYDPVRLQLLHIDVSDVAAAINSYFRRDVVGLGEYRPASGHNSEIRVLLQHERVSAQAWDNIPVAGSGSRIVYLGDIASVRYKEQPPSNYYRINGLNAIFMVVYAEEGANTLKVSKNVRMEVDRLRANLAQGYSILLSDDSTTYLADELRTIGWRTLASLLVLLVFVLAVSRQWRYLLLIAFSLFANLIIAVIFYYLLKLEIHLYSLAGISVSFGIIVTNSIVMIDHYRYHRNKSVFLAILAATLTTIGSLCMIFFLEEKQRINLTDFAWVMIVNLTVSMAVALWFIPSLMEKLPLREKVTRLFIRRKRRVLRFNLAYGRVIQFIRRFRWAFVLLLILGFGIPVHWLPDKIEKESRFALAYNKVMEKGLMKSRIMPIAEKVLGGSLRLFSQHVYNSSFYSEPQRTTLYVRGSMPEGCTVQQLNEAMLKMENYISRHDEVQLFQTSVYNYRNGSIVIHFKPEYENGAFPFYLKELLTSHAIGLGGVDWSIYGVGQGFSNALGSGYLSNRIVLEGFNYDQLYAYAQDLTERLRMNQRVGKIEITGRDEWGSSVLNEFYMEFDPRMLALSNLTLNDYYGFLQGKLYRQQLNPVHDENGAVPVVLTSADYDRYNTWWIKNGPIVADEKTAKLLSFGSISKRRMGNDVYRNNQQYRLIVAYEFIGPYELARRVMDRNIKETAALLPLGYKVGDMKYSWWFPDDPSQYYLIFLVLLIIYLVCAILLESLLQPLVIMALIPLSFVGVFLTFYLFGFNFDQGGFASFILLCGIVVNSGIFIINDYNNLRRKYPGNDLRKLYIKAYNQKIIPVVLTVLSTIIGLIPFVWGGQHEVFWFAFAAGTIGGLILSLIALVVYMPLFMRMKK